MSKDNLTVSQARKALQLFDGEYIGQNAQELWKWAVEESTKPPEPEYHWNDPIEYNGEPAIYLWPHQGGAYISTEDAGNCIVDLSEIKPAPYRIRLRDDPHANDFRGLELAEYSNGDIEIRKDGMSAQVEIID